MFLETMETYQKAIADDSIIAITDHEKFIGYLSIPGLAVNFPMGTPIDAIPNSITRKALNAQTTLREERGPEAFGFPYVATATPIWENGEIVGALTVSTTTAKMTTLRGVSEHLAASAEQMTATTEQLAGASAEMAEQVRALAAESEQVLRELDNIRSIAQLVKEVSEQSHLLGLNAAIEAARAGEHGRGFNVVAGEVRKMAEQSKSSAASIDGELDNIEAAVKRMNAGIRGITAKFAVHVAGIQELQAAYEHVAASADDILQASRTPQ
ncbi:MAG: hypothetical protein J7639_22195 [Paenibacillaceae bacterium]|nr:hypothetical protein [Paenibacillaceae bacterium]